MFLLARGIWFCGETQETYVHLTFLFIYLFMHFWSILADELHNYETGNDRWGKLFYLKFASKNMQVEN